MEWIAGVHTARTPTPAIWFLPFQLTSVLFLSIRPSSTSTWYFYLLQAPREENLIKTKIGEWPSYFFERTERFPKGIWNKMEEFTLKGHNQQCSGVSKARGVTIQEGDWERWDDAGTSSQTAWHWFVVSAATLICLLAFQWFDAKGRSRTRVGTGSTASPPSHKGKLSFPTVHLLHGKSTHTHHTLQKNVSVGNN